MYSYIFCGLAAIAFLGLYKKDNIEQWFKRKIRNYAVNLISEEIMNNNQITFDTIEENNVATLSFGQNGSKYLIHVPYDTNLIRKTIGTRVILIRNNQRIDVTQKPGVPYLFTANQMGGDHYELEKHGNVTVLSPDAIPFK